MVVLRGILWLEGVNKLPVPANGRSLAGRLPGLSLVPGLESSYVKYVQEHCERSLELEGTVLMGSVGLETVRRFIERSKRWTVACINALAEEQRIYAEKVYKPHRREYCRQVFV